MLNIFAFDPVFKLEFENYQQAVFRRSFRKIRILFNFWDGKVMFMPYNLLKFLDDQICMSDLSILTNTHANKLLAYEVSAGGKAIFVSPYDN